MVIGLIDNLVVALVLVLDMVYFHGSLLSLAPTNLKFWAGGTCLL